MNEAVKEILDVFNRDDIRSYPRDTLDQALQYEEELTPHLIAILENVLKDPERSMKRDRFIGHIFAMNLLAHFENQDLHHIIIKIMMLPRDVVDYLFGDLLTEDCPRILYQTCGGKYEKIKDLVLNREVDEFARGAAMKALVFGVLLDDLPRTDAVAFFGELFTGSESDQSSYFWDEAASCVYELYPEELMATIQDAYESDLIWPGYIGMETFERGMSMDKEDFLEEERQRLKSRIGEDFHDYMSWWACFNEDNPPSFGMGIDDTGHRPSSTVKKKKRKKKDKKKKVKASKRKNRRR